jgi:glucose-1-phosphate thymidylyltransferase
MQVVILAAGKGSRLHPITTTTSKAMLPIVGKPIVERVMQGIATSGLRDFIIVINPKDFQIREYIENESDLDINLRFVYQPDRLGMADALKCAAPLITEDFLLSACDNLVSEEDVGRLVFNWKELPDSQGLLTLIEIPKEDFGKSAIVTLEEDRVTSIVEKPSFEHAPTNFASMPTYCFSPRILDFLPRVNLSLRGEHELQDAIQMLIEEGGDVRCMFLQERFNLTTAADLVGINKHFLERRDEKRHNAADNVGSSTQLIDPYFIDEGTEIGSACTIGPNTYIGTNVRIGNNVHLRNVVVLDDAIVTNGVKLSNQVVV